MTHDMLTLFSQWWQRIASPTTMFVRHYKLKTHKGAAKRFKHCASDRITHGKCGKQHLNRTKANARLTRLRQLGEIGPTNRIHVLRMLGAR